MKHQLYYFLITASLIHGSFSVAQEGQLSTAFQRRFGIDSALFNTPLYFSTRQMVEKKAKPRKRKGSYRDEIRKKIARSYSNKRIKSFNKMAKA